MAQINCPTCHKIVSKTTFQNCNQCTSHNGIEYETIDTHEQLSREAKQFSKRRNFKIITAIVFTICFGFGAVMTIDWVDHQINDDDVTQFPQTAANSIESN